MPITTRQLVSQLPDRTRPQKLAIPTTCLNTLDAVHAIGAPLPTELTTALAPQPLLQALQSIEQAAGRQRPYRNAPRTLDLDILWFGDQVIGTPTLTVPHPRMAERAFVLRPLADLVPGRVSAAALQAVAAQSIYRLADAGWAEGVVGGDCS